MDATEYLRQKDRMTDYCGIQCDRCPLAIENNNRNLVCANFERYYPEEAVAAVENWAKERPAKTYKSVFLEAFPNAITDPNGYPDVCVIRVFGESGDPDECDDIGCGTCWDREVEE